MRLKETQHFLQDIFDVFFLLPKTKIEGLPHEAQVLVEAFVFESLARVDWSILIFDLIENAIENFHQRLSFPRLSLLGVHHINSGILQSLIIEYPFVLLDSIVRVAFNVQIMKQPYHRRLGLL